MTFPGKSHLLGRLRNLLTALSVILAALSATAQFNDKPTRVNVEVRVFLNTMTQRVPAGITVQLLDGFGSVELEAHTNGNGEVQFTILSGDHTLRIFGRGIEESNTPMQILPVEMHKTENIVVHSQKGGDAASLPTTSSQTVPARRLSIPGKAQQEFERGSNALGHKDWPQAKKHFEAAVGIFPDYDLAYNGLGDAAMAGGDLEGARTAFEKAISLDKNFAEAYRNLARVAFAEKKFEEADTLLTQSLVIDPSNARGLMYAANAELVLHKYGEAVEHARKVHSMPHDGMAGAHIVAARALEATQQSDEAVKEYKLYLSEEPQGRDATMAHDAVARLESAPK
jgi:tetratricopeptide (TPR) repeat protein